MLPCIRCFLPIFVFWLYNGNAVAQDLINIPASSDELRISLITVAPGEIYWERFGHNAILVENGENGDARLYNFGYFDFNQKNFLLNFIRGRMRYRLAVTDPSDDFAAYQEAGRSVWRQQLNLSAKQKNLLADYLADNALPENAEYRYDYFLDNCSTRTRDIINLAVNDELRKQALGRGRGETFRSLSLAYAQPIPWLALGIHLGLGPRADRRINFWEEGFLPLQLRDLVADIAISDAEGNDRPLVVREEQLWSGSFTDSVPPQPRWFWLFLIAGITTASTIGFGLRSSKLALRTIAAMTAASLSMVIGLIGLGLCGLWIITDHKIAWANANIWLFTPLILLLILPLWRLRQAAYAPGRTSCYLATLVVSLGLIATSAYLLKINQQSQADWIALLLPWHLIVLNSLISRRQQLEKIPVASKHV